MSESVIANKWGLSPILVFVLLVGIIGWWANSITAMPILVAFFLASAFALTLNPVGQKLSIQHKIQLFCQGGGDKNIILLVIIFLLAGAFYALTIDIGACDATVNLALTFIPTAFILPGLFLICCFISFSMGTSMGTISALSPIGIGLAESLGISVPLALGIVVGGAMFGDNLSFVSDTTIAATRSQGVKLTDKFKANLLIASPAALVTLLLLFFIPVSVSDGLVSADYDLWKISPYLLIIISALLKFNVLAVLGVGIVSAACVGLLSGDFTFLQMLQSAHKGMGWMQDLSLIAICIGGIVALMHVYGGMAWLIILLTKRAKSKRGAEFSIAGLVSFLDLSTANNTIAIVTAGPIARDLNDEYQVDPRRTASLLDIFSCGFQGLVPYGGQLLAASSIAGISPLAISLYSWYPMLLLVFGVLAITFGLPDFKQRFEADS